MDNLACSAANARGSCALGTTDRSAPTSAMLKNANIVPSTKATTMISANCALPAATAAASPPSASARTTSETIMIRLRSRRSASSPAGRTKSG